MAIELFRDNEEAYNSALKMLKTIGKAAIIHPTGTGKAFIGFKLCEDKIKRLNSIAMVWSVYKSKWYRHYEETENYFNEIKQ